MSIPEEAYRELQSIVGPEWVSDDPAICLADSVGGIPSVFPPLPSACSIEPATTQEVQAIVRLANRYKLPFTATSSYQDRDCVPKLEDTIFIDLKRMDKFEIDEDGMCATVEPGVRQAALNAEAMKKGLLAFVSGAGGWCSELANTINDGNSAYGWRYGTGGYRRILAVEWVLPDGDLLKLGSHATSNDYFWGEGPGPDFRGFVRGSEVGIVARGIITRIGVKLFPFIPEKLEPEGWAYHTRLKLPENRFKWYNITFPSFAVTVDAMVEMGKCEIGVVAMTVPPLFRSVARTRGAGCVGFWESWAELGPKLNPNLCSLRVLLYGIGSDKRLAYEEKVLLDIVAEFGGKAKPAGAYDETNFMAADANCANVVGGRFGSTVIMESMDHQLKLVDIANRTCKKYQPPLLEDYGTTNWIVGFDLGHCAKGEFLRVVSVEEAPAIEAWIADCSNEAMIRGGWSAHRAPFDKTGTIATVDKFKEIFDPNNLANPMPE